MNHRILGVRLNLFISFFLVLAVLTVYWQVREYDFINYDDDIYVTENSNIRDGLTISGAVWAFQSGEASNWHPVTWLSHMLDVELYGMHPGRHHMTNAILHIFNSVLLFLLLSRMTSRPWRSGFVAALFALHPLHVESVAWIAERKDVLSTWFFLLGLYAYIRYVDKPSFLSYAMVLCFFIMGLMAKPMVITFPFVLLLLDYWPFCRFRSVKLQTEAKQSGDGRNMSLSWLIIEKIPMFILVVISGVVTFMVQKNGGAVESLAICSVSTRLQNALFSYLMYMLKMIWPCCLSVFYPYPGQVALWKVAGAAISLLMVTVVSVVYKRKRPWLLMGWLWYIGTLVPVIGIVQVGLQGMADRYTYIPLIGLFVILSWGSAEIECKNQRYRFFAVGTAVGILSILGACTFYQVKHWEGSFTLFSHAVKVTKDNWLAHNNLGNALIRLGRAEESIPHFREALKINPQNPMVNFNLGEVMLRQGRINEAEVYYLKAIELKPWYAEAYSNLGLVKVKQGDNDKAITYFEKAVEIDPICISAHNNLGVILVQSGRTDEAAEHFKRAIEIDPTFQMAVNNLEHIREGKRLF